MFLLLSLLFVACTGKEGDSVPAATTEEGHPYAPAAYVDAWDIDSLGCDDATVYWAFSGEIDGDGNLSGVEGWYWFFSDEGWDDDCADFFDISAVEEPTPIADDACYSCDRDFTASYVMDEAASNCPLEGYEQLLDNDRTDRIEEEAYTMALMLDTDPLDGEEGDVNVWSYVQDDSNEDEWNDRTISLGTFTPSTAGDVAGPGTLVWARSEGLCIEIEEEEE